MGHQKWLDGKCLKGHDITIAANVRRTKEFRAGREQDKFTCKVCSNARTNRNRNAGKDVQPGSPEHLAQFEPRTCRQCKSVFYADADVKNLQSWIQRRYCTRDCKQDANDIRERNGTVTRPLPLDGATLARLRRDVGYDATKDYGKEERSMSRRDAGDGQWHEPDPKRNDGPRIHDLVMKDLRGLPRNDDHPALVRDQVFADMRDRLAFGISRYGMPLQPFNGRNAAKDAYEEALDLASYLRQMLHETGQDLSNGKLKALYHSVLDLIFRLRAELNDAPKPTGGSHRRVTPAKKVVTAVEVKKAPRLRFTLVRHLASGKDITNRNLTAVQARNLAAHMLHDNGCATKHDAQVWAGKIAIGVLSDHESGYAATIIYQNEVTE